MLRWSQLGLDLRVLLKEFALILIAISLLSYAILPFQQPSAVADSNPTTHASSGETGNLEVRSAYSKTSEEFSGIDIQILSGEEPVQTGVTPVNFTLTVGQEYTVVTKNRDFTFFSRWEDDKQSGMARVVRMGQFGDSLTALYRNITGAKVVSVTTDASVLDANEVSYPLRVVDSSIRYLHVDHPILDQGSSPKVYELADGQEYRIIATNSDHPATENFVFDHWIDPETNEKILDRTLAFTARDGLVLNSYYLQADPKTDLVFLNSRLVNGTAIEDVYAKVVNLADPPTSPPAGQGFTPEKFFLKTGESYSAIASEVCGFCLVKTIVFDHWDAVGGPLINPIVHSDEYHFSTGDVASRIDTLTAVYRIVSEDDFALVRVNDTGSDITVEIPPKINDGIKLEFTEVLDNGNVTAAENSVTSDGDLFDNVSADGIANMTVFSSAENGTLVKTIFTSHGPVLRINDGNLTLSGTTNVTIHYDPEKIPEGLEASDLHILHFNGTSWEDVTLNTNATDNTKTGAVASLSPFVIAWDSKFGIGPPGQPKLVEKNRGHGGNTPIEPVPTNLPILQYTQSNATFHIEQGENVTGSVKLEPYETNGAIGFELEKVTSPGNITVTLANSSELAQLFINTTGQGTITVLGSNFTTLGSLYNMTAEPQLSLTGKVVISVPYNRTAIAGLSGSNMTEDDVRFLYYDGSTWQDITILTNTTTDTVTGIVDSLSPHTIMTAAIVSDKTFGASYIDANPLRKVSLDGINLARDSAIGRADSLVESTDCLQNAMHRHECTITLTGSIKNAQRTSQNYVVIVQTTDDKGIVQSIEQLAGSLEKGEMEDLSLTWKVENIDGLSHYQVKVIILDSLTKYTIFIADSLELNIEL